MLQRNNRYVKELPMILSMQTLTCLLGLAKNSASGFRWPLYLSCWYIGILRYVPE